MQPIIVASVAGLILGSLIGWLWSRRRVEVLHERADVLTGQVNNLEAQLTSARNELSSMRAEVTQTARQFVQAEAQRGATEKWSQDLARRLKDEQSRAAIETNELRIQLADAQREIHSFNTASKIAIARAGDLEAQLKDARTDFSARTASMSDKLRELQDLTAMNASLQADLRAAGEKLTEQGNWIAVQSANLKIAFSDLAGTVVAEKTAAFKSESQESLQLLLAPLRDQMTAFQTRMNQIHSEDTQARAGLEQVMISMGRTHQSLAEQARSLSEALTQKPKLQGDFGEMKLEAQLEAGGFKEGHHYLRQPTYRNELDQSKRPDVVIRMPTRTGYLAVDSKVTLAAWVRLVAATSDEEREASAAEIIRCMYDRINELAARQYSELMDGEQPVPFTLMYVPIEGAALCAMEHEPGLFGYAQKQKVIIASPSTLFVMVGIIHQLWRVADQERNAKAIADEGGKLMAKFENFLKSWEIVGKNLDNAVASFRQADGQLHVGKGNAMTILQRMVALGVQARDGGAFDRAVHKTLDVTVVVEPESLSLAIQEAEAGELPHNKGGVA